MGCHSTHFTRGSDASTYDEICVLCGAHDEVPGGWGSLAEPCPHALKTVTVVRCPCCGVQSSVHGWDHNGDGRIKFTFRCFPCGLEFEQMGSKPEDVDGNTAAVKALVEKIEKLDPLTVSVYQLRVMAHEVDTQRLANPSIMRDRIVKIHDALAVLAKVDSYEKAELKRYE